MRSPIFLKLTRRATYQIIQIQAHICAEIQFLITSVQALVQKWQAPYEITFGKIFSFTLQFFFIKIGLLTIIFK